MICPYCHKEIPDSEARCPFCKAAIPDRGKTEKKEKKLNG